MKQRLALRLALITAVGAVLFAAWIAYWIPLFIYRPESLVDPDPAHWGFGAAQAVRIISGPNELFGWWAAPADRNSPVVLIVHGRSANISTRAGIASRLQHDGFGVLLFDYRGYGRSSGRTDEQSLTQDTVAAYDWLRRQGVQSHQVIVLGQSLGDAPAAQLAACRPVAALALVSPFTSLPDAMASRLGFPVAALPWPRSRFDVAASVGLLRSPVLFIVSRQDGLVPYENSLLVARRARFGHWLETDGLRHDGLLASVARDGRLSKALRGLR